MNAPSILSLDNSVSAQHKLLTQLDDIDVSIRDILISVIQGVELSEADAVTLFGVTGAELDGLIATADYLRQKTVGNQASFVITRNINFTNVCYMGCKFCGFAKRKEEATAELLSFDEVADRAEEAWARGATEVCIQGGLHPNIDGSHYREILKAIKKRVPAMHIHAFSPFEIWFGALKSKVSIAEFIQDLIDHGLGSMPGTAAEILDVEIRQQLTRDKLTTEQWVEIITTAHELGLPTTATIMYGHIDSPKHWAGHIGKIRTIQKQTGGFTEFVPLGFIHYESPLYMNIPNVRPGPTVDENIRMHAVSRLMLHGWIDNIQASWVKLGPEYAQQMLQAGANDLGGTLMNESISRAAGGKNEQEIVPQDMIRMISAAGRDPVRRNTLYDVVETYARQPTDIASREGFQLIATTNDSVRVAS
ncbi:5-amino-6-(D-ribitylamino)uracil--L-tyrosine 4-hydroxyphenyl transferase CofH [Amphritea sp. 1_MG-2023]|uniref:5-amino-6-(D-ribitylamino)uracil--L-tyrosine 4-hydroxyphenyl transferase CofH n=1 Tax=Amphritea sp. 1_MG-2023 TaxID=3062670 RepID=UPI0026E25860|nr:5-amino-6-(D-ribitylamino)uracil--L-tyrosine 4-hydroxyphenyl transferase CofH [Amphritea sp. 1_MG-2023]MDO6564736.1 5-amino-6-(D-ribitylamino)uracil--L-tyrosine 4-hydroxyphenyl transferase CofH [Amphritea sp. 1_MG-2023]